MSARLLILLAVAALLAPPSGARGEEVPEGGGEVESVGHAWRGLALGVALPL